MKTSIATVVAMFYVVVMATAFYQSIPNFCASEAGGNWIVQPLITCK